MARMKLPRTALSRGPGRSWTAICSDYLVEYEDKIRLSLEGLDDEQLWHRPAPGTNSAANLILHICGNLSLWILNGLGGVPFVRDRAGEFRADRTASKRELLERLREVTAECRRIIGRLSAASLDAPRTIQGYETDGRAALFHAVEHMSYHTGQIVALAKQLRRDGKRIEFYPRHRGE